MTVPSDPGPAGRRFLQLADVAEVLNISSAQVYALVRNGDLPAIKIGGRGQWRVEVSELEAYIARMYAETRDFVTTHRFGRPAGDDGDPPGRTDGDAGPDADPDGADHDGADHDGADHDGPVAR